MQILEIEQKIQLRNFNSHPIKKKLEAFSVTYSRHKKLLSIVLTYLTVYKIYNLLLNLFAIGVNLAEVCI